MAIASVVQGLIETEGGKVFELDSLKGSTWVGSVTSFRYVPTGANKHYTVRQETKKGGDYWYGYRKVAGKLHKRYIGKTSELSTAKLEEIAEALNTPQQSRVTQVTDTVTQVTEANKQRVTDTVTDRDTAERVTALELQMQAVQETLEELRGKLLGKSEGLGDSSELLNPNRVTDKELQNELSNLKVENEKLRADYAALLESSTAVTNKLKEEVQELRSQLQTEKTRGEELWEELTDTEQALADLQLENSELKKTCSDLRSELVDREKELAVALAEVLDLKQKSAAAGKDLPEAADLLNQLKTRRKKSIASLADIEAILEMIEKS